MSENSPMDEAIVAIGHVILRSKDPKRAVEFYRKTLGLKQVVKGDYFNAFEVGDVHFCIMPGEPQQNARFDFTARNVDRLYERLSQAGVPCRPPKDDERSGHRWFWFSDPDGTEIVVNSAHEPLPEVE